MKFAISIDPGNKKCGLVLADLENETVLDSRIARSFSVLDLAIEWINEYNVDLIILGNGTSSKSWELKLSNITNIAIEIVNERGTTFRARYRFYEISPPRALLKIIPRGLRFPPKNLDSIAALILLEDYLDKKLNWLTPLNLKIWP